MLVDGINVINKPFIDALVDGAKKIEQIKGIVIFGSSVRADCTEDSDIDIMLVSDTSVNFDDDYSVAVFNLLSDCSRAHLAPVDLIELSDISKLENEDSTFFNIVRTDGYKYIKME